jgi:hypothetical protein
VPETPVLASITMWPGSTSFSASSGASAVSSHDYSRIRLGAASDDEQAMLSALPSRHV